MKVVLCMIVDSIEKSYKKSSSLCCGFSLAEILITFLIVALIASVVAGNIAKDRVKGSSIHNYWACTRTSSGSYTLSTSDSKTGSAKSDHCEFIPPENFKTLNVSVIGAGGGGASGRGVADKVSYSNGTHDYRPAFTGSYYIILIGGGGEGGRAKCKTAQGGGSGGVIWGNYNLNEDTTYTIKVGNGGKGSGYGGASGDSTTMTGSGFSLTAGGGQGGFGRKKAWMHCQHFGGDGWGGGYSGGNGRDGVRGGSCLAKEIYSSRNANISVPNAGDMCDPTDKRGQVCVKNWSTEKTNCFNNLERILGENFSQEVGAGGAGNDIPGGNGYAMIVYSPIFGGGGGTVAKQSFYRIKKNPGKVKAYVGAGGKGAVDSNMPGGKGEASRFGQIVIAEGGEGGQIMVTNSSVSDTNPLPFAPGQNGEPSIATYGLVSFDKSTPSGGSQYYLNGTTIWNGPGSGGGGGAGSVSGTGKGADGANGSVVITW